MGGPEFILLVDQLGVAALPLQLEVVLPVLVGAVDRPVLGLLDDDIGRDSRVGLGADVVLAELGVPLGPIRGGGDHDLSWVHRRRAELDGG